MNTTFDYLMKFFLCLFLLFTVSCSTDTPDNPIENKNPTCSITNPQANAQFNANESIPVTVVAEDSDGTIVDVRIYIDNVEHSLKQQSPYNFTINAGEISPGTHILKAVAKDNANATAETMVSITVKPLENNTPTCSITNPQANAQFNADESIPVTVVAEDSDGTIVDVRIYIDNVEHSLKQQSPYNFTINAGEISPGTHILKAVAKDNASATAEATVNIIVNPASTESPDFITFTNGEIPNTWQSSNWTIDSNTGYDDSYSLKAITNNATVSTSKTCNSNINFVEFYLKGIGTIEFYIDDSKQKVCELTDSWVKHSFYLEQGLHTFKWEFSGTIANLDAIHFKTETKLAVGMYYQGGIIAYLDNTNQHGLIAAPEDQSPGGIQWYNGSNIAIGTTNSAIGRGQTNTTAIIEKQGSGVYAAKLCDDLNLNGYNDWFLPSKNELNEMYTNRFIIGGFNTTTTGIYYYWSSTENSSNLAWYQNFNNGTQRDYSKLNLYRVRAVRTF